MKQMLKYFIMMCMGWSCLIWSVAAEAADPIVIALSAPLSGPQQGYGESFKKGVELALAQINAAGGLHDRMVELAIGDSQDDPQLARKLAREFVQDERIVAEIGDFTSNCCLAAQSIYDRGGMAQLAPAASHPSFTPGSPYSFGIHGTQEEQGVVMADMAVNMLQHKKLAVIFINTDWGVVAKKYFAEEAERLGATIVAEEGYLEGTSDFLPILERLREVRPELIYLCVLYHDAAMILQQRQELGWHDVAMMGSRALFSPHLLEMAGEAAEGLYASATFLSHDPRPEVQEFVNAYTEAYHESPTQYAALAYDAMNLLAEAIRQGGTERSAIRDTLEQIEDYPGVTGTITFTQFGGVTKEHVFVQVNDGQFVIFAE